MQKALHELFEEFRDIISLHQDDIGYPKFLTMYIDTEDHPPMAQNFTPYH